MAISPYTGLPPLSTLPVLLFIEPSQENPVGSPCSSLPSQPQAPGSAIRTPMGHMTQPRLPTSTGLLCCLPDFPHPSQFCLKPSACQSPPSHFPGGNVFASEEGITAETSKKKRHPPPEPHTYKCACTQAVFVLLTPLITLKLIPPKPRTPLCSVGKDLVRS